mmetsp:Transcript_23626/g.58389  ORF Transcript_23626/g.58389 Transcript_23626/m.58389 type:complete len:245 (-) Transcript_23626:161-895(-)|eukprot:CAMPEP_0206248168 /NCGR_PEP_ID=MMETSP0047_2-20121206/20223_1 /ASSEMBLY_ACC=CAM_ASM_000192 /TAXON_ID=195065 /ORGANISM="Chroomonas mesostigmatica_cf, Strain CCMP1168" /LENGTH=244 /DNA_ID=CAMNT_0053673789 /DNA_START=170 /DNA_END=904 /DNA_ORIENTATION=+
MCSDSKPAAEPPAQEAPPAQEVKNTLNIHASDSVASETPRDQMQDAVEPEQGAGTDPVLTPEEDRSKLALGAAGAGFAAGYLLAGPFLGLAGAAGGYVAANGDGKVGNAARSVGGSALKGYKKGSDMWREQRVGEKVRAAWGRAVEKTKEVNERYKIGERARDSAAAATREVQKIDQTFDLTGKAQAAHQAATRSVASVISGAGARVEAAPASPSAEQTPVIPVAQPVPVVSASALSASALAQV